MDIIDRILRLAQSNGLTAYKVAKDCGFDKAAFTHWKNGKQRPNIDALTKLADYFGVTVDYLIGRETPAVTATTPNKTPTNVAVDVTTAPILQIWAELDEIQKTKALTYCKTLIAKDNRHKGVVFES